MSKKQPQRLKLYRFMGQAEYEALISGQTLTNTKNHAEDGSHTDSVGFCFTASPPFKSIHWLSGVVDTDYCVCIRISPRKVKKCRGRYGGGWKDEYCCTSYKLDDIELVYASREWSHIPNKRETDAILANFGIVPVKPDKK